jgi:hypothetical protein
MAFKKSGTEASKSSKPAAAAAKAQPQDDGKEYPCAYVFGAVKNGEEWEEEKIMGMFLEIKAPTEKTPEGAIRIKGKLKEELTIPAGAILKIKLNGSFEKLGLKAIVNEDGDVSFESI